MTLNRKIANFRGHYVSHERRFRGHLKKSRAKSPFFEGQGKPCLLYYIFSRFECLIIICGNYPIIISDNCHVNFLCGVI